jgi:HlyD family secretion protein
MILDVNKPYKLIKVSTEASIIAFFLGIGLLTISCSSTEKEAAQAQPERQGATPVDVAIARTGSLQAQLEYTGTSAPFRIVSVRSQVEGKLLDLKLDVGDSAKIGQIVGQLDDALLLTALNQATSELAALKSEIARATTQVSNARALVEQARLEVVQATNDATRQDKLLKEGAIALQSAEQARTEARTATQALRAATEQVRTEQQAVAAAQGRFSAQQAVVAQAKERRSYAQLKSPITGIVTEKVTEPGNLVQPGGEVLKIGDFSRVKVVVQVSELELAKIAVGQSVQVRLDAFPNESLIGRVARISPTADATARLVPVEVVIPNGGGKIGSGLLARVNFQGSVQQRVVVPQSAFQGTGGDSSSQNPKSKIQNNQTLFVVRDVGGKPTVTARSVRLGSRADGKVEILSGLQPGESYVVQSGKPLKDGETVRLSILSEKN